MDFKGLDNVVLPAGADSVQVDLLVLIDNEWQWILGTPNTDGTVELPTGLPDPAEVAGTRVSVLGDFKPGAELKHDLTAAQRATDRGDKALGAVTTSVPNEVSGTVSRGETSKSSTAQAGLKISPSEVSVEVAKTFDPKTIVAGDPSSVTITAKNGDEPVRTMSITEKPGFFTEDVTFAGWTEAPTWPTGAESAQITYLYLDETESVPAAFDQGAKPSAPSRPISGFEIMFTGDIAAAGHSTLKFDIQTTEDLDQETRELPNSVEAEVVNKFGLTDTAQGQDELEIITPGVDVSLTKTVRPDTTVRPGQFVGVELEAVASKTTTNTKLNTIVVQDMIGNGTEDPEFWNAFDIKAIAPTQVPAHTDLTVEVYADGQWQPLTTMSTGDTADIFAMSSQAFASALAGKGDVTGIRFTFDSTQPGGYEQKQTVRPALVFEARGTLRAGKAPATGELTFKNAAISNVAGKSPNDKDLSDSDRDTGDATIEWTEGGPGEGVSIVKKWNKTEVGALTSEEAATRLSWRVGPGFDTVRISDAEDHGSNTANTVFDAFNLLHLNAVPASKTPFTHGWFMKYDSVTEVIVYELVAGVVTPRTIAAPNGTWTSADGGFKGYQLTTGEQESVIGIDVVLTENGPAREAAQTIAALDPFAPKPQTGVGSSGMNRQFDLTWQLRDKTRAGGTWITSKTVLNQGAGSVLNTTKITGTAKDRVATDRADDTILIVDHPPLVKVVKDVDVKTSILTPKVGAPDAAYATPTWTIKANNGSATRASFVRVTDPLVCDGGLDLSGCKTAHTDAGALDDPFTLVTALPGDKAQAWVKKSMFEQFTATGVTISAEAKNVDLASSVAWILSYDAASKKLSTLKTTAAEINAQTAGVDWAQVVGISVTFRGIAGEPTITNKNDLRINIGTTLRTHLRTDGTKPLVLKANDNVLLVKNEVYAQAYTPLLGEDGKNGSSAEAAVTLTGGTFAVTASKKITPTEIARPAKDTPVTVTLGGTSGKSTLSPEQVVIEDHEDSAEFWDRFDFTGLGAIAPPAGADLIQVDAFGQFAGQSEPAWLLGAASETANLPALITKDEYSQIAGIRFTFTKTGGGIFVPTPENGNWATSVNFTAKLREHVRGTDKPVEFVGVHKNLQTITSSRKDQESVTAQAAAEVALSEGTHKLSVEKIANNGTHLVSVGKPVPFDLVFKNSGTGYLSVDQVTDQLPKELVWTGEQPTYATTEGGTLATDGVQHALGADGNLVFTWPNGANIMQPGETFTITLELELQPLPRDQKSAVNTMVVQTGEKLETCGHLSNLDKLTNDWQENEDRTSCGAYDHVQPQPGANLFVAKGVRHLTDAGDFTGAYRNGSPQAECALPTLRTKENGNFFRSPCVTHSEINGVDDWVLFTQNAGTDPVTEMVIFDQLPVAGDQYLIGSATRGSNFRPQITGPVKIVAPEGVTFKTEVTYAVDVCAGTWTQLGTGIACGEDDWVLDSADTAWDKVSGLRITANFANAPGQALAPGEAIEVHYSSKNIISTERDESGSSRAISADNQLAINQFGVQYRYSGTKGNNEKIAPYIVGVDLPTGSLVVTKEITGAAAEHAPASFLADVSCMHGDTPLLMGNQGTVELNKANDFGAEVTGILLGSECAVVEETKTGGAVKIDLGESVLINQDVQETPIITVTNTFDPLAKTGTNPVLPAAIALVLLAGGALFMRKPRKTGRHA